MAENINININAKDNASTALANVQKNITGVSRAATATQKGVAGLGTAFAGLKTIVAGLALGNVVTSAFRLADSIVDLSLATDLSTKSIIGFSQAVAVNGGELGKAQIGLTKFTQLLGDARNGVDSAQKKFAEFGVSISDIQNLSEQDILRKTVQGLGNINDAARRSAGAVDVFGRSFAGVDIKSVNEQLDGFIRRSGLSAAAVEKAGEVQGNLADAFQLFQIQLLTALEPLSELAIKITKNTEAISKFLDVAIKVGIVIASLFGANLIGKGITMIGTGMRTAATGMGGMGDALRLLKKGALELGLVFDRLFRGTLGSRGGAILGQIVKQLGFMVIQFGRLAAPMAAAVYIGVQLGLALRGITKEEGRLARVVERVESVRSEIEQLTTVAQTTSAIENATRDIERLTQEYERLRAEQGLVGKSWDAVSSRFGNVTQLTALEEELDRLYDLRNVAKLRAEEIRNGNIESQTSVDLAQQQYEAEQRRQALAAEGAKNAQATIDTIAGLKEELMLLGLSERQQTIYNATKQAGNNATIEELALIQSLAGEIFDLTQIKEEDTAATEAQIQAQQQMNQAIARLSESYQDAVAGAEAFVKNKQAEYEFQNKINVAVGAQRDFLQEMAEFDRERISNLQQLKVAAEEAAAAGVTGAMDQYNAAVQAYEAQRELFAEQARQQAELQNSFAQGWKESIADVIDSFKPYNQAQNAIQKGWGAISDAVDNFTRTGKFKFKDFALSAIADITSMVLKAQLLKGISGGLGLFGIKLPGLAQGGPAQAGQPYMVGEKGPELFVPKQSGTVVPNGQLGGMQQPQQINNTYVTNNINAVDAKSVAQLFVENRKTLLGATMMARKEMPYGMG